MFLSLLPAPDPRTFLPPAELRKYYNELLQYHQRNAELLSQIMAGETLNFSATDFVGESMQSRDAPAKPANADRLEWDRTDFFQNGNSVKNGNFVKNGDSHKSESATHRNPRQRRPAAKKHSSLPANRSRAPETEKLIVPNNLGASILAVMQKDPNEEYTSEDILKALNPVLPYGENRIKAASRYADRLGTLEKKGDIVRVTKGRYKLAGVEPTSDI